MSSGIHQEIAYEDSGIAQPYHLVRPSIWPFLSALAAGLLAVGALFYMHHIKLGTFEFGLKGIVLGFAFVLAGMFFWWRDIIREAVIERAHTPIVKVGLRYGMALFIASEVMFFVAFFWAFFGASLFPAGGVWPPTGIVAMDPLEMPLMMTLVLLLSGTTVTWAHHAILEGRRAEAVQALTFTVVLGILFSCFQMYEYYHATFAFKGGIFPSTFYMATGFHGFHVIVGTIFLAVCLFRTKRGDFTPDSHFGFEAAAWYWHFVDVVWLFLFVAIYWWGGSSPAVAAH